MVLPGTSSVTSGRSVQNNFAYKYDYSLRHLSKALSSLLPAAPVANVVVSVNGANIRATANSTISLVGGAWGFQWFAGANGTVNAGSLTIGTKYQILSTGNTSFTAVGAASNSPGTSFVATGVGAGTGTALVYPLNAVDVAGALSAQSINVANVSLGAVTGNKINVMPYYSLSPPGTTFGNRNFVGGITQVTSP